MADACIISGCGRPPANPKARPNTQQAKLCVAHLKRCTRTGAAPTNQPGGRRGYSTKQWRHDLEERVGIEDPTWGGRQTASRDRLTARAAARH